MPGYDTASWTSAFVRRGTDPGIVATVQREIEKAARVPEVAARFSAMGLAVRSSTSEQLGARVDAEIHQWGEVLIAGRIRIEE